MSVEKNIIEPPSIDAVSNKIWETIKSMSELVVEWLPQMGSFAERNQQALNAFLETHLKTKAI
jgi:hypothetical protein